MLKTFGGQNDAPSFINPSPKNGPFVFILFQKSCRNVPISRPGGSFSKKATYNCSSALNDEVPGEKWHLISKMVVLQQICHKTARVGQKRHFFGFLVGALPLLRWGVVSSRGNDCSTQNYKRKWAFLKKMSERPRYGGLILGFRGNGDENLGCKIVKNGAENYPTQNISQLFRTQKLM